MEARGLCLCLSGRAHVLRHARWALLYPVPRTYIVFFLVSSVILFWKKWEMLDGIIRRLFLLIWSFVLCFLHSISFFSFWWGIPTALQDLIMCSMIMPGSLIVLWNHSLSNHHRLLFVLSPWYLFLVAETLSIRFLSQLYHHVRIRSSSSDTLFLIENAIRSSYRKQKIILLWKRHIFFSLHIKRPVSVEELP